MTKAETDYLAVKSDNERLREMLAFAEKLSERKAPLAEYYFSSWLDDYTKLADADFHNQVMNEDAIYNEMTDQYELAKKLLLICAKYINAD